MKKKKSALLLVRLQQQAVRKSVHIQTHIKASALKHFHIIIITVTEGSVCPSAVCVDGSLLEKKAKCSGAGLMRGLEPVQVQVLEPGPVLHQKTRG